MGSSAVKYHDTAGQEPCRQHPPPPTERARRPRKFKFKFRQSSNFCKEFGCTCDNIVYSVPTGGGTGKLIAPAGKVGACGSVGHVIAGSPPAGLLARYIDADSFRYSLGAGTIAPAGDNSAVGEMIAFNGNCYVTSTRIATDEYMKTLSGSHMRCPCAVMVSPADAVPQFYASTSHGGMSFTSAVNDVCARAKELCKAPAIAIGGMVKFKKMLAVAIARSNMSGDNVGENIFEQSHKYYPNPPMELFDQRCVVFGVAGNMVEAEKRGVNGLDAILYGCVSGGAGACFEKNLSVHMHVVVLKQGCVAASAQDVQPQDVAGCYHLDTSSIVGDFSLEVWPIQSSLEEHPTVRKPVVDHAGTQGTLEEEDWSLPGCITDSTRSPSATRSDFSGQDERIRSQIPSIPGISGKPSEVEEPAPRTPPEQLADTRLESPSCNRLRLSAATADTGPESPSLQRRARGPDYNCSEWICDVLAEAGVTHVFGGHGGSVVPLVSAIVRHPKLRWVVVRNEASASLMAAAHAKLTSRPGCCVATSGPGATNLTTGLCDALSDEVPVIAITGLKPRAGIGHSEFQDFNQSRLFAAGGLLFSKDVTSPEALPCLVRDAVARAVNVQTCVHLAVPVDIQAARCPAPINGVSEWTSSPVPRAPGIDRSVIDTVAMEIKLAAAAGQRIVVTVGHRCVEAGPDILRLAERINANVLTRLDAKGCCDESHPLVLGVIGVHGKPGLEKSARIIESASVVFAFGTVDSSVVLCNRAGAQVRHVIQFEPNPAVYANSDARFRALQVVFGDPAVAIGMLLDRLDMLDSISADPIPVLRRPQPSLSEHLTSRHSVVSADSAVVGARAMYCHPSAVLEEMSQHLGPNDVLCSDVGDVTVWTSLSAVLTRGQRTLSSESMGTMGYGLCAGIVASLVRGASGRGVVVAGDGGLQMTVNEFGTFQQQLSSSPEPLRLLVIVFDNQKLGRVEFGFDGAEGCELGPSVDFASLAKAYGCSGAMLRSPDHIRQAVKDAFSSEGLFVLHVLIDPMLKADMATLQDTSTDMPNSG